MFFFLFFGIFLHSLCLAGRYCHNYWLSILQQETKKRDKDFKKLSLIALLMYFIVIIISSGLNIAQGKVVFSILKKLMRQLKSPQQLFFFFLPSGSIVFAFFKADMKERK